MAETGGGDGIERFPGEYDQNAGIIRDARKMQQEGVGFGGQKMSNESLKMARQMEKVHHERQVVLSKQGIKPKEPSV